MSHSLFAPFSHPSFPLSPSPPIYPTQPPLLSPCIYTLNNVNNVNNKEIGEDTKERKPIISSGRNCQPHVSSLSRSRLGSTIELEDVSDRFPPVTSRCIYGRQCHVGLQIQTLESDNTPTKSSSNTSQLREHEHVTPSKIELAHL